MKISHRLSLLTAVASISLLGVAAVGVYGVTTIRDDLQALNTQATPLLSAVLEMRAGSERVLANLHATTFAKTKGELATAHDANGQEILSINRLAKNANKLDPSLKASFKAYEKEAREIRSMVEQRILSTSNFTDATSQAKEALLAAEIAVEQSRKKVASIAVEAGETAQSAHRKISEISKTQSTSMAMQTDLKELLVLLYAADGVSSAFKIGPLRERFTSAIDSLKRGSIALNEHAGTAKVSPDMDWYNTQFNAEDKGLFAAKSRALGGDRQSKRVVRKTKRTIERQLRKDVGQLEAIVDDLEISLVWQNGLVAKALEVTNNPDSVSGTSDKISVGVQSMAETFRSMANARDVDQLDMVNMLGTAVLTGLIEKANVLHATLNKMGRPDMLAPANALIVALANMEKAVPEVHKSKTGLIQSERALVKSLSNLETLGTAQRNSGERQASKIRQRQQGVVNSVEQRVSTAMTLLIAIASVTVLALIALSYLSIRMIVRRLNEAVKVANTVAQGRLTPVALDSQRDEISLLFAAMSDMVVMLSSTVLRIRESSGSVHLSASELSRGNLDLSGRTEHQAAQLQESASAMNQLRESSEHSADSAKKASQLAGATSEQAIEGRNIVGQAMESMKQVLSGSEEISKIIAVIDGIAFQTNILALNAAVEAARAGEQGRGFAVVAGEVRALASKSAAAASQISEIIKTNVDQVEQGSSLVNQAGRNVEGIVSEIDHVTNLIGQVSSASQEQVVSIQNVNSGVGSLEEVTQQNAALAEQSSAASDSLVTQANALQDAVRIFELEEAPTE